LPVGELVKLEAIAAASDDYILSGHLLRDVDVHWDSGGALLKRVHR
jgi:hypothetical protein